MSTPRIPNQKKQYAALNTRLAAYVKLIERLYDKYSREAALLAVRTDYDPSGGKLFRFSDYPQAKAAIERILDAYVKEVGNIITRGTAEEWKQSNAVQDLVARKALRSYGITDKEGKEFTRYYQSNSRHLKAFQQRRINGMSLSKRVWDLRAQYKRELELGLSAGVERGKSANELASELKRYLNKPDKLFRRVRDKFGRLALSKNAKAYHPGRGVYRSSFKNAQRLTRSEINMSYRTAEQTRWRQFDFVVGYEIKLSYSHPEEDICDKLKGKYPKSFVWTGWHPNDLCYEVPILKSEEEFYSLDDNPSANEVTDVPQGFKDWVKENSERIGAAGKRGTEPYFIRDNKEVINGLIKPGKGKRTALEVAKERHAARSEQDTDRIQKKWNERKMKLFREEQDRYELSATQRDIFNDYLSMLESVSPNTEFNSIWEQLQSIFAKIRKSQTSGIRITEEQGKHLDEIAKALGIKRGNPMTLKEADVQSTNPNYNHGKAYGINCQTCVPAYGLRAQGLDITAKPNTPGSLSEYLSKNTKDRTTNSYNHRAFELYENKDGTIAKPTMLCDWARDNNLKKLTWEHTMKYIEETCKEPGVYEFVLAWKGGGAHATIIQRFEDGTIARVEPQVYRGRMKRSIEELSKEIKTQIGGYYFGGIMRIDNKRIAKKYWSIFEIGKKSQ